MLQRYVLALLKAESTTLALTQVKLAGVAIVKVGLTTEDVTVALAVAEQVILSVTVTR